MTATPVVESHPIPDPEGMSERFPFFGMNATGVLHQEDETADSGLVLVVGEPTYASANDSNRTAPAELTVVDPADGSSTTFAFNVTWTKESRGVGAAGVDGDGWRLGLWNVTLEASLPLGDLAVSGSWVASPPFWSICTADFPPTGCRHDAAGSVNLTGHLGADPVTLAGTATDYFCTQPTRDQPPLTDSLVPFREQVDCG